MGNQLTTTPRDCATALLALLPKVQEGDFAGFSTEATPVIENLLKRHDLLTLGVPLRGGASGKILYCDGGLTIVMGLWPPARLEPPHDHTMWQMIGVYRGSLEHVLYKRLDTGDVDGYAELEIAEERRLTAAEVVPLPPPPHDIHSITTLDHTWILAVMPGWLPPYRRYFDLERNSYFLAEPDR